MARERQLARSEPSSASQMEPWNTFRDMERMFRDFFLSPASMMRAPSLLSMARTEVTPEVDLKETDKELILSASLPGLSKDDINIDVTSDSISVSGERKQEQDQPEERYHFRQQSYGSFQIRYSLPVDVKPEEVKASYKDGILSVHMPKAEVKQAHKVNVETQ